MKQIVLIISLIIVLVSCSSEKTYTEEVINGVRYVKNIKESNKNLKVKLEKVAEIDFSDESSIISNVRDISLDSNNRIFIHDDKEKRILKFSPEGTFIDSFGRGGIGPFEIGEYSSMTIVDDTIIVNSSGEKRYSFYDLEGKGIKEIKIDNHKQAPSFDTVSDRYILSNSSMFHICEWKDYS